MARECEEAVRWALEPGYRHIDTAQAYGNEASVGRALRDSGVPRADVFITTKFYPRATDPEAEVAAQPRAARDRLRRPLHHPLAAGRPDVGVGRDAARPRGRLRAVDRRVELQRRRARRAARGGRRRAGVNQVQFSPFEFRRGLLDGCDERDIALEAYSPLGTGQHLGDAAVAQIADRLGRTPAQVLIRWSLQRNLSSSPSRRTASGSRRTRSLRLRALRRRHGGPRRARHHRRHRRGARKEVVVTQERGRTPSCARSPRRTASGCRAASGRPASCETPRSSSAGTTSWTTCRKCQFGETCSSRPGGNQSLKQLASCDRIILSAWPRSHMATTVFTRSSNGSRMFEAEAVHAEQRAGRGELLEVVEVGRVAAVGEHDPPRVDALLVEHPQRVEAALALRVRVDADRRAGLLVDAADRAHDALDVLGQAGGVDRALEDPGLDAAALDPVAQVGAHQLVERLVAVEQRARAAEVPRARQHVVRVEAGREDDVQPGALARAGG